MIHNILRLCKQNMTEEGFDILCEIEDQITPVWDRPSSSTGKYHKRSDGSVSTIGHHTYEMMYAGMKTMRQLEIEKNTIRCDVLCIAIHAHDMNKYGIVPGLHTATNRSKDGNHSKQAVAVLQSNSRLRDYLFHSIATWPPAVEESLWFSLLRAVGFHNGIWEKEIMDGELEHMSNLNHPLVVFVHTLDMLSAAGVLRSDLGDAGCEGAEGGR